MPLCRLRQAVEAATSRIRARQELETRLAEAQTKTICSFLAASAGLWMNLGKGEVNPLIEQAARIDFLGSPDTELDDIRGEKVADDWRKDPRLAPQAADPAQGVEASNAEGSFEAFMTMFGAQPGVNGSG